MQNHHFDELTKSIATGVSRRQILKMGAAALFSGIAVMFRSKETSSAYSLTNKTGAYPVQANQIYLPIILSPDPVSTLTANETQQEVTQALTDKDFRLIDAYLRNNGYIRNGSVSAARYHNSNVQFVMLIFTYKSYVDAELTTHVYYRHYNLSSAHVEDINGHYRTQQEKVGAKAAGVILRNGRPTIVISIDANESVVTEQAAPRESQPACDACEDICSRAGKTLGPGVCEQLAVAAAYSCFYTGLGVGVCAFVTETVCQSTSAICGLPNACDPFCTSSQATPTSSPIPSPTPSPTPKPTPTPCPNGCSVLDQCCVGNTGLSVCCPVEYECCSNSIGGCCPPGWSCGGSSGNLCVYGG